MASEKRPQGAELESDITFIATPAAQPSKFATNEDCGVKTTNVSMSMSLNPPDEVLSFSDTISRQLARRGVD